jgi:hypothetical protein
MGWFIDLAHVEMYRYKDPVTKSEVDLEPKHMMVLTKQRFKQYQEQKLHDSDFPVLSVVLDKNCIAWQKDIDAQWYTALAPAAERFDQIDEPITVLFRPLKPPYEDIGK